MNAEFIPFPQESIALGACLLRPLEPTEAEPLGRALAGLDPWRPAGYQADAIIRYLLRPDPSLQRYAVTAAKELAGVVCARYPWLHGAYLELIGILPAFQRRGLGGAIVQWFETRSFLAGSNAWIVVSASNTPARRFYHRQGFVEVAALPGLVQPGDNEILLRKVKSGSGPDRPPPSESR